MFHRATKNASRSGGFTLVELLIVIAIIAILATLVVKGLGAASRKRDETDVVTTLSTLKQAIEQYQMDEGKLPASSFAKKPEYDRNDFPKLWSALMDDPPRGGRNAPYVEAKKDRIMVRTGSGPDDLEPATKEDVADPDVEKYYVDPWGKPYVYRCNRGLPPEDTMLNPKSYDLYSLGPNMKDDTIEGMEGDENDDLKIQ